MELIRLLLLHQEAGEKPAEIDNYDEPLILYNAALAVEAGLLEGKVYKAASGEIGGASIFRLTWAGHDFLDATKDPSLWAKAKEKVIRPGASWTFGVLLEYLKAEAKHKLGLAFGGDIAS